MSVAKAYAKALFEAAVESKLPASEIDSIEGQLRSAQGWFAEREIRVALMSPAVSAREKAAVMKELSSRSKFTPLTGQFLVLLANKERLSLLSEIVEAFSHVRLEAEGGVLGKIDSADPMDAADIDNLSKAFTKKLGRRVAFQASTDPQLLAGMRVTVSGVTYDGSLKSQLQRLRDQLVHGTSLSH